MAQLNQEPSMEDILASIKRIIAEDTEAAVARAPRVRRGPVAVPDPVDDVSADAPPAFAAAPVPEEPSAAAPVTAEPADVLELTSPLIDPEPETMSAPAANPNPADAPAETAPAAELPPAPPAPPAAPTPPPVQASAGGPILSGAAAIASRNAFAALNQLQVRSDEGQSNTLEGLVADLLRPMLRDWLDRELPGIVERLVQDEIKRVSGR